MASYHLQRQGRSIFVDQPLSSLRAAKIIVFFAESISISALPPFILLRFYSQACRRVVLSFSLPASKSIQQWRFRRPPASSVRTSCCWWTPRPNRTRRRSRRPISDRRKRGCQTSSTVGVRFPTPSHFVARPVSCWSCCRSRWSHGRSAAAPFASDPTPVYDTRPTRPLPPPTTTTRPLSRTFRPITKT